MITNRHKSGFMRLLAVLALPALASLLAGCFGISQEITVPAPAATPCR